MYPNAKRVFVTVASFLIAVSGCDRSDRGPVEGATQSSAGAIAAPATEAAPAVGDAAIISPEEGAKIPGPEDPPCSPSGACSKVTIRGKIAPGLTPFVAVAPILAGGKIWVQPKVLAIRSDGTFTSVAYLGGDTAGAGEQFTIFVFGHKDRNRFAEADVLEELPRDCIISEPVTVLRTK